MPTPAPATKKSLGKHHRFERDVISLLTARAEKEAGYTPGKMGWLAWFARIFRGESEQLQKFRHLAEAWPPLEREIFEMYFVDRLALADIALVVGCTSRVFQAHLCFIQRRLREALVQEVLTESKALLLDNWTLRVKCRACATGRGLNPTLTIDHA